MHKSADCTVPGMPSAWQRRSPCVSVGIAVPAYCPGCQIEQRVSAGFYEKCFLLQKSWSVSLFGCPFNDSWISFIRTALSGDVVCRSADVLNCYPPFPCQGCCHLSPAMTDGQVGTHEKRKGQKSLHRVSAVPVPLGDTRGLH